MRQNAFAAVAPQRTPLGSLQSFSRPPSSIWGSGNGVGREGKGRGKRRKGREGRKWEGTGREEGEWEGRKGNERSTFLPSKNFGYVLVAGV